MSYSPVPSPKPALPARSSFSDDEEDLSNKVNVTPFLKSTTISSSRLQQLSSNNYRFAPLRTTPKLLIERKVVPTFVLVPLTKPTENIQLPPTLLQKIRSSKRPLSTPIH
ncbi:hypothetical protein RCL1_001535 [Eukaryota sp. TZLM3-RCL]